MIVFVDSLAVTSITDTHASMTEARLVIFDLRKARELIGVWLSCRARQGSLSFLLKMLKKILKMEHEN